MANRLVSNVYIIDSQQNAVPLAWGDSSNPPKLRIASVGFVANDTTASVQIAVGASNNVVLNYGFVGNGSNLTSVFIPKMQIDQLGGVEWALPVYIPVCVAGTAYLYIL